MISWWLALEIIGLAALPIAIYLCSELEDAGYAIAKLIGLVLVSYIAWLLTLFYPYGAAVLYLSLAATACFSIYIFLKFKIEINGKRLLWNEAIFTLAFLAFTLIRSFSPDYYWTAGEKMMEFGFIKAILRSSFFPPFDPWFAGEAMHYYYFGFQAAANLAFLSNIDPAISFNLAVATFFALTFNAAFGIGLSLCRDFKFGLLTSFLVTIIGNLMGFLQLLAAFIFLLSPSAFYQLYHLIASSPPSLELLFFTPSWYWASSRVIPNTINEFPFFSFLHGDLHPHMVSIAFQLLLLYLLLTFFISRGIKWSLLLAIAISLGFLFPLNSWDFPTYFFLTLASVVLKLRKQLKKMLLASSIVSTSILLYLPLFILLASPREIGIVIERTSLLNYLVIFLIFLFPIASYLLASYKARFRELIVLALLCLFSLSLDMQLLVILLPVIAISIFLLERESDASKQYVLLLILTGALLSLFCEFFYIKDAMGLKYHRMNTVFKLYLQNWLLFAIAASHACFSLRRWFFEKKAWAAATCALILMGSLYPFFAVYLKSNEFKNAPELDGTLYIKREHAGEYEAIRWLNENVKGAKVILQAPGSSYTWSSYISAYTGLPTPIGWAGHELNWRNDYEEVNRRIAEVDEIYTSSARTKELLKKYNITYIYVGSAEQLRYGSYALEKFNSYELAFANYEARIYKI
jgi:YYY domain-containing protein